MMMKRSAMNPEKMGSFNSWDIIPIPDTVIAHVNTLGADQPEQLIFFDCHSHVIGDDTIPGVPPMDLNPDNDTGENTSPPTMELADVELPGVEDTNPITMDSTPTKSTD
jgi:hypothetical protein